MTPAIRGLLWMNAANVLFAVMTITARLASRSTHWSTIAASRALIGALVALTIGLMRGVSLRPRASKLSWARSLLGTVSMLTTFYAIGSPDLAVGDAVTLFATSPLFIAALSPWLLKERIEASLWVVLIVAFFGAALVAGPHLSFGSIPAASALIAALFSALAMTFLRKLRTSSDGEPPDSPASIALHFGLVAFSVFLLINLRSFRTPELIDCLFLVLAGLSGGVAQLAMTRAYALAQAARLGAVTYIGTVVSLIGSFLVLGERPSLVQLIGSSLVIGAGALLAWMSARHAAEPLVAVSVATEPTPSTLVR